MGLFHGPPSADKKLDEAVPVFRPMRSLLFNSSDVLSGELIQQVNPPVPSLSLVYGNLPPSFPC